LVTCIHNSKLVGRYQGHTAIIASFVCSGDGIRNFPVNQILCLMPTPQQNETFDDFVSRCIPVVISEGTANNPAQAYAICEYMYQNKEYGTNSNQSNKTESQESKDN